MNSTESRPYRGGVTAPFFLFVLVTLLGTPTSGRALDPRLFDTWTGYDTGPFD